MPNSEARHIRVWCKGNVIAWIDTSEADLHMGDLIYYLSTLGYGGLREEDFDLSHRDGSRLEDIYLRRFENAKL